MYITDPHTYVRSSWVIERCPSNNLFLVIPYESLTMDYVYIKGLPAKLGLRYHINIVVTYNIHSIYVLYTYKLCNIRTALSFYIIEKKRIVFYGN